MYKRDDLVLSRSSGLLGDTSSDVGEGDESLVPLDERRVLGLGVDSLGEEGDEGEEVPRHGVRSQCILSDTEDERGTYQGTKARSAIVTLFPTR